MRPYHRRGFWRSGNGCWAWLMIAVMVAGGYTTWLGVTGVNNGTTGCLIPTGVCIIIIGLINIDEAYDNWTKGL